MLANFGIGTLARGGQRRQGPGEVEPAPGILRVALGERAAQREGLAVLVERGRKIALRRERIGDRLETVGQVEQRRGIIGVARHQAAPDVQAFAMEREGARQVAAVRQRAPGRLQAP